MFKISTFYVFAFIVILTVPKVYVTALVETHPKLQLKSYKLFATNRTVLQNETHLLLPRVFDELVFECNSTVPTGWKFFGPQITDPTVKKIEVNKWRQTGAQVKEYRSTLKILFSNPVEMINMSCENICSEKNKSCQNLNAFLQLIETPHISNPFFDLRYAYGNKSLTSFTLESEDKVGDAWLGRNTDCKYALHVDLESGKYACVSSTNSHYEVPSIFLPCGNPDECDTVFKSDGENCNNIITFQRNCTHPHCSEIRDTTSPFVIACGETNDFSVARSFFKTLDSVQRADKQLFEFQPKIFSSYDGDLVSVTLNTLSESNDRYGVDNATIYFGYPREFECIALRSLFSHGIRWRLRYKDNSVKDLGLGLESLHDTSHLYISKKTITFDNLTVESVICEAPNWNSFSRTSSTFNVSVQETIKPSNPQFRLINQTKSAEIRETELSSTNAIQNLTCFRSGTPPALIIWIFDGVKPIGSLENNTKSTHYTLHESVEKSEVTLNSGHPFIEIVCTLKNVAGSSEVHFKFRRGTDLRVVLTVSLLSICLVILIIVIVVLKIRRRNEINNLTEKEIEEFKNGNPDAADAFLVPYNMDLEVSEDHFFASNEILGSGAYGKVVKGRYGVMDVAIKTIKKSAGAAYLKALLSELKIMSYVGRHPNIVNLLGACTQNIRKREISIILEYCERGDMVSLLRKNRGIFVNYFETKSVDAERISIVEYHNQSVKKLCTLDLVRWAVEIARGMEFLSSKNVIHGDLAGRNILITKGLNAKVSDFGLAKQLFEYSTYVQKRNVPLPLRWMAYESLKDLQFSVQSDIWSYGMVLWEIFSLGETPYPGMEWGFESWKEILNGRRNDKPDFASDTLYKIMLECWNLEPNSRPCFRFLWESILDYSNDLPGLCGNYIHRP